MSTKLSTEQNNSDPVQQAASTSKLEAESNIASYLDKHIKGAGPSVMQIHDDVAFED